MRLPPAIGRYRTQGLLGTGSFATVLLAEDEALETRVAIKVLAENWSLDPDVRERFVREARILRRIDSPRLIRVHDIGEFDQRPYFVMDFAPGGTLAARLDTLRGNDRLPLSDDVVMRLAAELAGCIGAAHSFGVIHRDVKPSNLLVRPARASGISSGPRRDEAAPIDVDEELVLADFGLARDLLAGSALSVGAGTHGYMAPEQAAPGQPVDERTDVYACTVILASVLTGAAPAVLADRERREAVLMGLDPRVSTMLERGLSAHRDERPATAEEWLAEVASGVLDRSGPASGSTVDPARPSAGVPRWLARSRRAPMIGRERGREEFDRGWEAVLSGERRALLFAGEAGIGKTRMLAELATAASERGAIVLAGRCDEPVRAPYGALVDALRSRESTEPLSAVIAQAGPHAGHLALVVPELAEFVDVPPADIHPDASRALLLDAIDRLLGALADGAPMVLVADDLHAADPSTLGVLRYLVRQDRPEPFLLLGAYRDTEVGADHPLMAFYEDLHRHRLVARVELAGLDEAALGELVARHTGTPPASPVLRSLRLQTGGNPFFVEEILTSLVERRVGLAEAVEQVPDGARDVVRSRIRCLSVDARRGLATAAVVGNSFERRVVERVEPGSLVGLDEAMTGGFIEQSEDRLAFRHGLVRAALLADLSRRDEVTIHWQVGVALERAHASDIDAHITEIAHHLQLGAAAGDAAKAGEYLERAGEQQFRALALDEAVASLSASLDLMPEGEAGDARRLRTLELLAETHFWRDDPDAMRAAALAAADLARRCGSAEDLARTVVVAARWNRGGEVQSTVLDLLDEAESRLPPGDSGIRSQVLSMRAYVLQGAARGFETRPIAEAAEAMARRCDDVDSLTMALLVRTYAEAGAPTVLRTRQIVADLEAASAQVSRRDHREQYTSFALRARAQVQLASGDRSGFAVTRAELGAVVDRMRASFVRAQLMQWDAAIAIAEGRFSEAVELTESALATWDERPDAARVHRIQMGVIGMERGGYELVLPEIERLVAGDASSVGYTWRAALTAGLAAIGRTALAQQRLADLAAGGFRGLMADHYRPAALRWLAEAVAGLGDADAAEALLPFLEPYTGVVLAGPAVSTVECSADRAIGQMLAVMSRHHEAQRHFERAAALEGHLGFDALEVRTRGWWAWSLRDSGDIEQARSMAAAVVEQADRLGMVHLAESARRLTSTH